MSVIFDIFFPKAMNSQFVNPPIYIVRPLSLKKNYDQNWDVTMGSNVGCNNGFQRRIPLESLCSQNVPTLKF